MLQARKGLGDFITQDNKPVDPNSTFGQYWCNTLLGQWLSPMGCYIQTPTDIRNQQMEDMGNIAKVNPSLVAQGIKRSDKILANESPQDYAALYALTDHPTLSKIFSPDIVGSVESLGTGTGFGMNWGTIFVVGVAALIIARRIL